MRFFHPICCPSLKSELPTLRAKRLCVCVCVCKSVAYMCVNRANARAISCHPQHRGSPPIINKNSATQQTTKKKINTHRLARIFLAAFAWISLPVLHFVPPAAAKHTHKKKRRYASPVVGLIIINRRSNALSHKLSPAKRRSRICEHCFFLRIAIRLLLPAPVGPHTRTARAHDVLLHLQTFRKPLPPPVHDNALHGGRACHRQTSSASTGVSGRTARRPLCRPAVRHYSAGALAHLCHLQHRRWLPISAGFVLCFVFVTSWGRLCSGRQSTG